MSIFRYLTRSRFYKKKVFVSQNAFWLTTILRHLAGAGIRLGPRVLNYANKTIVYSYGSLSHVQRNDIENTENFEVAVSGLIDKKPKFLDNNLITKLCKTFLRLRQTQTGADA